MPAVTKNLTIEQKATFRKKMVYRDKFKKPINLTGFSARMQIRAADGSLIADLSTQNGKIILGGTITPATPGTQTPANTTLMNPVVWRCNNAQALAVGFDMINFYIETDY